MGHIVGSGEISPHPDTIEKIRLANPPRTKKEVRAFIGLTGYYRNYIPNYAAIAVPLTDLTKNGQPNVVVWGDGQNVAFETLKSRLVTTPILKLPDFARVFVLRSDASDFGLGAVLLQVYESHYFPVSYASKKLLPRETRYSVIEKECLGLVWAIKKFESYLYGREFVLQTDHEPLVYINRVKVDNNRVMRWALFLQPYRFRIEAIKGSSNHGADYLSRLS